MIKNQKSRKLKTENQYGKISDFFCKEQANGQISSNTGKKKIENTNY